MAGDELFVANQDFSDGASWVTEVDLSTGLVARVLLSSAPLLADPQSMAVSGPDLFVAYELGGAGSSGGFGGGGFGRTSGYLSEVEMSTGTTLRQVTGANYQLNGGLSLLVAGPELFVASLDGSSLTRDRRVDGSSRQSLVRPELPL